MMRTAGASSVPGAAGVFLGLGFGGFFDGIVLHQILQWHHMLTSAGHPPDSIANLKLNTLADGLFHAVTYVFLAIGTVLLWRAARRSDVRYSGRGFLGATLVGFGLFNLVEGIVSHHLLGLHHVNETVPRAEWVYWDAGFLLIGALSIGIGALLWRRSRTAPKPA